MTLTAYGTRESSPIARPEAARYGGNTTCYRISSACIPDSTALIVDAGSGLIPVSRDLLGSPIRDLYVLMTHYHHDHTQGFPLAPHTYARDVTIHVLGPREHGVGPAEMLASVMKVPFFPVDFPLVASHFECHVIEHIGCEVLLVHPTEGFHLVRVDEYGRLCSGDTVPSIPFTRASLDECLTVRMYKTLHPEYTVSYGFEERPSRKVLAILTDHENTESIPDAMRAHLLNADLLIEDAQYTRERYEAGKAGYGHGTGDYTARVMLEVNAARLAQTHHDPLDDDLDVDAIVQEARDWLTAHGAAERADRVFALADYQVLEL